MKKPLDELYFEWLYGQVGEVDSRDPTTQYWKLLKILYEKEFVWIVANDDNRAEDGRELRIDFERELGIKVTDPGWKRMSCSFLELLIGLARRLAFETDGQPAFWFWHLINNLGLSRFRDGRRIPADKVDDILETVIWRNYEPDGRGGLFPLQHPTEDQRDVELWYQLCSYLLERD